MKPSSQLALSLYTELLRPRLIEEKMLLLLRKGQVSKWFSGIGQEAISVGATMALDRDEYILPLHRNLGVFTARGVPLSKLFAQWQGHKEGFTKGRERSFHFGTFEHHIVGMISHLGAQMGVADGIALAHKLRKEKKVAMVFTGEGGTSEGDFHESINLAAVWDLPVLFIIENNGYGLSTPTNEQYRCEKLSDRAKGYGIEGVTIDGNDVWEVYRTVQDLAARARVKPAPAMIECMTFRMKGHEEASGTKYVPKELFELWAKKDPIARMEAKVLEANILKPAEVENLRRQLAEEIDRAVEEALSLSDKTFSAEEELADVYAPSASKLIAPSPKKQMTRLVDAISDGLAQALEKHSNLIIMGQDVAEYGGVFKITEGFVERFGKERIRNTTLCESAVLGTALGLSISGMKSVVEMQFADFVTCGFNQIVNNLAKSHYRWGANADTVIRMPTGAGVRAGPFHSQSTEAWFFHVPGLKIVYPAFPADAKGLLLSAIEDPNPVMFFEHKALYRSVQEEVPEGFYTLELGQARLVAEGSDFSIITYGWGVHWALEFLANNRQYSADILDLRTLQPLNYEAISDTVRRTHRALILHEATMVGGIGAELAAWIGEHLFQELDAPVVRCASLDTPVPFAAELEDQFLAKRRLATTVEKLLKY